jgi:RHS repeat-associated protein
VEVGVDFHMPLRWPGHYYDSETGLQDNRFRTYSPELGRYLQSDPIGTEGGINLYAYTDNPLRAVDLRGNEQKCPKHVKNCPHQEEGGKDAEGNDLIDKNKPLQEQKGKVNKMKELDKSKNTVGEDQADRHHMPSKLAIKKAIHKDIKERLSRGELKKGPSDEQKAEINRRIDANAQAMVVDKRVHKEQRTTGGKNKTQSDQDINDLGAAAKRDARDVVDSTERLDPKSLDQTQKGAEKISSQTHESIMEENRKIVDDVLAGR